MLGIQEHSDKKIAPVGAILSELTDRLVTSYRAFRPFVAVPILLWAIH